MFHWRKSAEPGWIKAHEDLLQARAHGQLVIVRRPNIAAQLAGAICACGFEANHDRETIDDRQIHQRAADL